ncbi:hypothetical protein TEA_011029 [Camellia sinensis var. sinensis]|uniref:Uncharacterized protein n=1 Tax=Camellia sinensis var. sinensis TaxID=542762 RepID=A0A4S4DKG3_CAMSN|nr:hypothetical protein TEA_011029 [Camellia sinensis var. sinensis]
MGEEFIRSNPSKNCKSFLTSEYKAFSQTLLCSSNFSFLQVFEQFRIPEIRDAITEFHLIVQWSNILRPITRDDWNHHHMNNFVQFFENLQGDEVKSLSPMDWDYPVNLGFAQTGLSQHTLSPTFVYNEGEESLPDGLGLPGEFVREGGLQPNSLSSMVDVETHMRVPMDVAPKATTINQTDAIVGNALQHNSPPSLDDLAPGSMTPNLTDAIVGNALQHNSPPSLDDLAPGSTTPNPTEELKGKISEIDDKAERMRMEIREMETKVSKLTAEKEESMEGEDRAAELEPVQKLKDKIRILLAQLANVDFTYHDPMKNFDRTRVKGVVAKLIKVKDCSTMTALESAMEYVFGSTFVCKTIDATREGQGNPIPVGGGAGRVDGFPAGDRGRGRGTWGGGDLFRQLHALAEAESKLYSSEEII